MADIGQHYCLRWNNYQSNMTSVFYQLLRTEAFVDVTLNCNENSLKAHKVVLSACSSYFQKLLMDNPCKHPTIILPQEIDFNDLKFIIEFVYRGEIDVSHSELQSLLKTADQLKIKGLCEVPEGDDENEINSEKSIIDVGLLGAHILHDKSPSKSKLVARYRCGGGGGGGRYISTSATSTATTTMSGGGGTTQTQTQTQQLHQKRKLPAQEMNSARKYCAKENKPVEHSTAVAATTTTTTTAVAVAAAAAASMQLIQTTTINANDMLDRTNNHQQYHNLQPANCITVATSTEEDEKDLKPRPSVNNANLPAVVILDNRHPQQMAVSSAMHYLHENPSAQQCQQAEKMIMTTNSSPIMNSSCTTLTTLQPQPPLLLDHQSSHRQHLSVQPSTTSDDDKRDVEIIAETQPLGPTATPVHCHSIEMQQHSPAHRDIAVDTSGMPPDEMKVKFETLRTMDQASDSMDTIENHMSEHSMNDDEHTMQTMMITPELFTMMPSTSSAPPSEVGSDNGKGMGMSKKDWTQEDMEAALDALRNHHMSLTKASSTYGIPSTTLWQRAHRLGIDTPKKDGTTKSWNEDVLNIALDALRNGTLSANKASKTFGIPSSTLYKIARREGIRLAAPFNAAPTTWSQDDLERALDAIRTGQTTVQKAATEYGIPTGTLYGRCKREKIELSRSNPTPWSQDAMSEALEAIRLGHMSINQASIHYNLPYSSLYGRFRRGKYEADHPDTDEDSINVEVQPSAHQSMMHHAAEIQVEQQQQHTQSGTQTPSQPPQPQIMLLQYQHAPATHIQMYQPAAPS